MGTYIGQNKKYITHVYVVTNGTSIAGVFTAKSQASNQVEYIKKRHNHYGKLTVHKIEINPDIYAADRCHRRMLADALGDDEIGFRD